MPTGLPPGLGLNASTGAVTGTPTTAGEYTFTIQAKDVNGLTVRQAYTLTVYEILLSGAAPDGIVGEAYSYSYTASGGVAPLSTATTAGTLPTSLSLSTAAALTGTPTVAGTYTFSLQTTDTNGGTSQVLADEVTIYGEAAGKWALTSQDGSHVTKIWRSTNLVSWTEYTMSNSVTPSWIDGSADGFAIAGSTTAIGSTDMDWTDGVTTNTSSVSTVRKVRAFSGLFVAYGINAFDTTYYLTSTDGITWTERSLPLADNAEEGDEECVDVAKLGSRWLMLMKNGGSSNWYYTFWYSDEAVPVNWTKAHEEIDYTLYGMNVFGSSGVAYNDSRGVVRTTTGSTWTKSVSPIIPSTLGNQGLYSASDGAGTVIIGGKNRYYILSTDDMATWTQYQLPSGASAANWSQVSYGDGTFAICVGSEVWYTTDGTSWTQSTLPSGVSSPRITHLSLP